MYVFQSSVRSVPKNNRWNTNTRGNAIIWPTPQKRTFQINARFAERVLLPLTTCVSTLRKNMHRTRQMLMWNLSPCSPKVSQIFNPCFEIFLSFKLFLVANSLVSRLLCISYILFLYWCVNLRRTHIFILGVYFIMLSLGSSIFLVSV